MSCELFAGLSPFDKILFVSMRRSRDCLDVFSFVCLWLRNQDVERGSTVKCHFFPISKDAWEGWAPEVQRKAAKTMGERDISAYFWRIKFLWAIYCVLCIYCTGCEWEEKSFVQQSCSRMRKKTQNWENIYEKHKERTAGVHLEQGIAGNRFL